MVIGPLQEMSESLQRSVDPHLKRVSRSKEANTRSKEPKTLSPNYRNPALKSAPSSKL